MTFNFKRTTYNKDTLQQLWMSIVGDSHDMICKCETPFAHILYCIFPEGHKDRELTVKEIIERDLQICHSGGTEEESHGLAGLEEGGEDFGLAAAAGEEEYIKDEELTTLLAAAEDATTR